MNDYLKQYRERPLGAQLSAHFESRAQLRRDVPLFSFSLAAIVRRFEMDTSERQGVDLQQV